MRRKGGWRWSAALGALAAVAGWAAIGLPAGAPSTLGHRAQTAPDERRAGVPGTVDLPARGSVDFSVFYPFTRPPPTPSATPVLRPGLPSEVVVTSYADQPATVSADFAPDGFTVTIAAPAGYSVRRLQPAGQAAVQPCIPMDGASVTCHATAMPANSAGVELDFTAFAAAATRPPVQSASLGRGDAATLVQGQSPDEQVEVVSRHAGAGGQDPPDPVDVSWDGKAIHISAPAGVAIVPDGDPLLCSPAVGGAHEVTCPATGSPPGLFSFSLDDRRAPAKLQALAPPGSLTLPPDGRAVLAWPAPPATAASGPRAIFVTNHSEQTATLDVDESTLTISVPTGYIPVPDADCSPGEGPNVSLCPLAGLSFVTFDAADALHPQPLPQQVRVNSGQSVALSAAPDSPARVIAVGAVYDADGPGSDTAPAVTVAWDGTDLTFTAPDGFKIAFPPSAPYGEQDCTPTDDVPTSVTCPAPGLHPRLFHVGTQSLTPQHILPGRRPGTFATIVSPSTNASPAVGSAVSFAANGAPNAVYIWQFGDGTIAVGQVVQHAYASAGFFTAALTVVDEDFGQSTQTQLVAVGQAPVQVSYPAGRNLIGVPSGTVLAGVQGPLYTQGFCANVPAPPPPPLTSTPPSPCDANYKTVPADEVATVGFGYWAYFPQATTLTLPFVDGQLGGVSYPAGTWFTVGNPTFKPAAVRGADLIYVYDPAAGGYQQTDTLQPGQGAWVYSASGATITIYARPPAPPPCMATAPQPSPAWGQRCPATSLAPRGDARMAFDAARNEIALFGGIGYEQNTTFNDTWTWNGTTWTQQYPASSPAPRGWPALAYDAALGQVVLFGGAETGSPGGSDETWTWDGSNWTQQQPAASPPARYNAALAYDAARGVLVLFGGFETGGVRGGYLDDTWTYDGRTWTPVCGTDATPVCGPPPGFANAMAYDPLHQQIVMFGGSNGDNCTWTWDGSGWTLQQPVHAPPAPQFGTMAFDPLLGQLGQIVLVGSDLPGFGTFGNQVWVWDGADWTQLQPAADLPPRRAITVAFDPNSDGLLLFGGGVFANGVQRDLGDTWVLR